MGQTQNRTIDLKDLQKDDASIKKCSDVSESFDANNFFNDMAEIMDEDNPFSGMDWSLSMKCE